MIMLWKMLIKLLLHCLVEQNMMLKLLGLTMLLILLTKLDGENFPFVKIGDSDRLIIGEWAIAMGNLLDFLI